jgi:broad specificity phosphatase PhoE
MHGRSLGTRFLLLRHGERDHSVAVANNALIPLTPRGVLQASTTGHHLAEYFNQSAQHDELIVLSSPFLRCLQTSEEICKALHCHYFVFPRLCEFLSKGDFSTHPGLYFPHRYSHTFRTDFPLSSPLPFTVHNGDDVPPKDEDVSGDPPYPETRKMFLHRFESVLRSLSQSYPSRTFICVCHGAFLHFLGKNYWDDPEDSPNLAIADIYFSSDGKEDWRRCIQKGPLGNGASHLPSDLITY